MYTTWYGKPATARFSITFTHEWLWKQDVIHITKFKVLLSRGTPQLGDWRFHYIYRTHITLMFLIYLGLQSAIKSLLIQDIPMYTYYIFFALVIYIQVFQYVESRPPAYIHSTESTQVANLAIKTSQHHPPCQFCPEQYVTNQSQQCLSPRYGPRQEYIIYSCSWYDNNSIKRTRNIKLVMHKLNNRPLCLV